MANPYDLFAQDDPAATDAARIIAEAMARKRAAGTLTGVIGGPFAAAAKGFGGDADQSAQILAQAGMHRSNQRLLREKMDAYGPDQEAIAADRAAKIGLQRENLELQRQRLLRPPVPKEPKPLDPAKRSLGEYLTPTTSDLTDAQRNELMNTLAVPGAQWLDQMAELSARLDEAGSAPSPDQLANIQRLLASSTVKLNKVAGLGALSGPDIEILRKASGSVGELTNWLGQATGLRDLKASVRSAAQRGAKDIEKAAGAYGSRPVPGKALDISQFDTRVNEYRTPKAGAASPVKRPRRTVGAETREWDGQAWVPVKGE